MNKERIKELRERAQRTLDNIDDSEEPELWLFYTDLLLLLDQHKPATDEPIGDGVVYQIWKDGVWQGALSGEGASLLSVLSDRIFIAHIKSHLKPGQKVVCKICGRAAQEICKTEPTSGEGEEFTTEQMDEYIWHPSRHYTHFTAIQRDDIRKAISARLSSPYPRVVGREREEMLALVGKAMFRASDDKTYGILDELRSLLLSSSPKVVSRGWVINFVRAGYDTQRDMMSQLGIEVTNE